MSKLAEPGSHQGPAQDERIHAMTTTEIPSTKEVPIAVASADGDGITPSDDLNNAETVQAAKDALPAQDVQRGVQQVEAVTLIWTKPYLIAVFILYVTLRFMPALIC